MAPAPESSYFGLFTAAQDIRQKLETFRDSHSRDARLSVLLGDASLLLGELDVLQNVLEQSAAVEFITSLNGPSYDSAVGVVRSYSNEFLKNVAEAVSSSGLSRGSSGFEDARDKFRLCSALFKDLNVATLIYALFHREHRHASAGCREDVESLLDKSRHPCLEVIACYGRLIELADMYDGFAERPDRVQQVDLEVDIKRLLENLVGTLGLDAYPIQSRSMTSLESDGASEYQIAIDSIQKYGSEQDIRIHSASWRIKRQCLVTVNLANRTLEVTGYLLFPRRCCWLDDQGRVVLEQVFTKPPSKRYPWRHHSDAKMTVTCTIQDAKSYNITSYREPFGLYKDSRHLPKFVFHEQICYEQFQSDLRERRFVREFETLRIKASAASYTPDQCVKVWQEEFPTPNRTITLPITREDQVHHKEIKLNWMTCETTHSIPNRTFTVVLKFRTPATKAVNGGNNTRRKSWTKPFTSRRASSSSTGEVSSEEVAPQALIQSLGDITITFKSREVRDEFINCFTPKAESPSPSPIQNGLIETRNHNTAPHTSVESPLSMLTSPTGGRSNMASTPADSSRTQDTSILPSPATVLSPGNEEHERTGAIQPLEPYRLPAPYAHEYWRRGGPQTSPANRDALRRPISGCYRPLEHSNCIRVLRIKEGSGSKIVCHLEHCDLSELPAYEALSYCWGDSPNLKSVSIDDNPDVRISEHLWNALQRLRFADRDRCVWIDAICIDQDNVVERNTQILLMPTIYQVAYRTIIWIGNLELTAANCKMMYPANGDHKDARPTLCTPQDRLADHEHNQVSRELGTAIKDLQRQMRASGQEYVWWQRLWCVQEFYFSARQPTVYIGPHAIGWRHFAQLFDSKLPLSVFQRLIAEKERAVEPEGEQRQRTLFDLLFLTRSFGCRDPRDRVFSLLGMAPRASDSIQPDYTDSVLRVLENACLYLIHESNCLDVLLDGRRNRRIWCGIEKKVPTWIPDLTSLQGFELVKGCDNYCAGPGDPEVALVDGITTDDDIESSDVDFDLPRGLNIRAVYFDTIISRTREEDIPDYEPSPKGHLVYNSLLKRGHLLETVLKALNYKFEVPEGARRPRDPCIGELILHYLFEEKRSIVDEIERRAKPPVRNRLVTYQRQRDKDLAYVQNKGSREDEEWVRSRWHRKIETAEQGNIYQPEPLRRALKYNKIWDDFLVAREFENVFAYARKTFEPYYFTANDFDAPMYRDVLESETLEDVRRLYDQYDSKVDPEFHEYNAKNRKRDFFRTRNGFLGIGPDSLEVGDDIVMAFGASRPLILRSNADGPGQPSRYQLVGEAFLPNFMGGRWTKEEAESAKTYCIE